MKLNWRKSARYSGLHFLLLFAVREGGRQCLGIALQDDGNKLCWGDGGDSFEFDIRGANAGEMRMNECSSMVWWWQ